VTAGAEEVLGAADVDVVDLCVPASTQRAEMLRRALASGDEIIDACRQNGVRLCYAENWVYAPPIQRARRLLTAAGGPILRIVGEESHGGTHAPVVKFQLAAMMAHKLVMTKGTRPSTLAT
jgi:predicted dehydrogenase